MQSSINFIKALATAGLLSIMPNLAQAVVIDFDSQGLSGPSTFAAAGPATTEMVSVGGFNVEFSGGVILTNTTNLPADQTSIYGTADFGGSSYSNPLTVQFFNTLMQPVNISNFYLDVLNGNTVNVNYTVADNLGNTNTTNLAPNLSGGQEEIGFAAAGNTVTISGGPAVNGCCAWDFFIDNIHFNEPLPSTVPEPSSLFLFSVGLAGINYLRRKAA